MTGQQTISASRIFLPSDAAGMSEIRHELRTHLNHIVGYSEMIMEEAEDLRWTAGRRTMEDILSAAHELTEGISNIIRYLDVGDRDHCVDVINISAHPLVIRIQRLADQASSAAVNAGYIETSADANRVIHACQNIAELFTRGLEPVVDESAVDRTPARPLSSITSPKSSDDAEPSTSSARILTVDDNEVNLTLLRRFCERRGHVVTSVGTGEDALAELEKNEFDLCVLDIMLPGINGFEVLEKIGESNRINVPVIVLSSLDDVESMVTCLRMGAEDFLRKPFVAEILEARILAQLEKKRSGESAATIGIGQIEPQNPDQLSKREIEVLTHLAMGKSNREIGEDLFITENTVVRHVSNIFSKAGLSNRAVAGVYAVRLGLVQAG